MAAVIPEHVIEFRANTDDIAARARIIARHLNAMADELEQAGRGGSDPDPAPDDPPAPKDETVRYDPASTTAASTERAASWDHDRRMPVTASRFGFRPPAR